MPLPLGLIIASAALTAAGAMANARARQQADQQQANIIQNQRDMYDAQRQAILQRQEAQREFAAQDRAQAQEARQAYQDTLAQNTPEVMVEELAEERTRLADEFLPQETVAALGSAIGAAPTPASDPLASRVVEADAEARASSLADELAARTGALAGLTSYGTQGTAQGIRLGQGADEQRRLGNLRAGTQRVADRYGTIRRSGEASLGAAGNAMGNELVPLDTSLGDTLAGLGGIGFKAAGAYTPDLNPAGTPNPYAMSASHSPWITPGQYGIV